MRDSYSSLSLSISVITQSISSPTLNIFFAETFFLVQLSSLEWSRVVRPALTHKTHQSPCLQL